MDLQDGSRANMMQNTMAMVPYSATSIQASSSINSLPNDLIMEIFEVMIQCNGDPDTPGMCSAICLGLTSPRFYVLLKHLHPAPLGLNHFIWIPNFPSYILGSGQRQTVANLIKDFIGDKYRLAFADGYLPFFLSIEVYGHEKKGEMEMGLGERHYDYRIIQPALEGQLQVPCDFTMPMLPNPYRVGNAWYEAVASIIEQLQSSTRKVDPAKDPHTPSDRQQLAALWFTYYYHQYLNERFWNTWQGFWDRVEG